MKNVNENFLKGVKGGAGLSIWAFISIIATGVFAAGIFDGFVRPFGCRN